MAQAKKDNKFILEEKESRTKFLQGAAAVDKTVGTTYGPRGRNVLIERVFGRPTLTRDGVTVARETYFSDRAMNMGAQILTEASEVTNRIAGDGTSATVVLANNLLVNGAQAIEAGKHPMEIKDTLVEDSYKILTELEKIKKPIKKGQLEQVATVSSGDPLIGKLIAEAVEYVGADGGIITEKSYVQDIEREYVDGYYLQTGFEALQSGKKELLDPIVIVSSRRLSSAVDAKDILEKAANIAQTATPRFLLIGNFDEAAYHFTVQSINQGLIDAIIIKTPPQFGAMANNILEDIAIYAGCEIVTDSTNLHEFDPSFIGSIDKVVASKTESTLFYEGQSEAVEDRIAKIKEQIDSEISDAVIEKLRDRVAKLEGKIALFRIGGATDTSKEEKEYRVEDGILATRAAYSDGVVPGGGTTLLRLSNLDISEPYKKALRSTFQRLLLNANLPAEVKLQELLNAPEGQGYNLRKGGELVDLVKEGILDPVLVTEQTIKNATDAVAGALTVGASLILEDSEE